MPPVIPAADKIFLVSIRACARKAHLPVYIVGGYLRDLLLGRQKKNPDIDFAVPYGAILFGRVVARALQAGFVVLDTKNGSCRVVKKHQGQIFTFDFTDFRSSTLHEDLVLRDFTINALAADLESALIVPTISEALIDLYGSQKDLKERCIRVPSPGVFDDDPLRVLRAFSFSARFGFTIEKKTLALAKKAKNKLVLVSQERIRDELFKIFSSGRAYDVLTALDRAGILTIVMPELERMRKVAQGPYHHLDVLAHSFESVRQFERLAVSCAKEPQLHEYLTACTSGERTRLGTIALACLVHDIGKPAARKRREGKLTFYGHERVGAAIAVTICRRLALSNDEIGAIKRMVFWHLRPGYLGDQKEVTERASFRYFRDTGVDAVATLLLSIADQRSTKGPLTSRSSSRQHEKTCFRMVTEYFRAQLEPVRKKLISGDDLMKKFRLEPSPLIGMLLSEVQELQAIGKITTKAQALEAALRLLAKQKRKKV